MALIALEGTLLAIVVYAPLIFYILWSWRLLRRHSTAVPGSRTCLYSAEVWARLLVASFAASLLWPVVAWTLGGFSILLTYNLHGEELALAQFFVTAVIFPTAISSWVAELLPGMAADPEIALLCWLLPSGLIAAVLLSVSLIEGLFIRRVYVSEKVWNT